MAIYFECTSFYISVLEFHNGYTDFLRVLKSQELMAQACNPSYSGGRDWEDRGSKPAQANSP
jgi:hypothetical protein